MIDVKNLHKYFGSLEVLKGIDCHIDKGECVCVIGLTKVSDFVISRIFEALAPLLGTALIYYVIVKILTLGLNALERRLRQSDRR